MPLSLAMVPPPGVVAYSATIVAPSFLPSLTSLSIARPWRQCSGRGITTSAWLGGVAFGTSSSNQIVKRRLTFFMVKILPLLRSFISSRLLLRSHQSPATCLGIMFSGRLLNRRICSRKLVALVQRVFFSFFDSIPSFLLSAMEEGGFGPGILV